MPSDCVRTAEVVKMGARLKRVEQLAARAVRK
jgi:hypothetical protein